MPSPTPDERARRLLDAQVRFHLDRLTGDQVADTVTGFVDTLLDAVGGQQLEALVDRDVVADVVVRGLGSVPPSTAVRGVVELVTEVLHTGTDDPYPLDELTDRDEVEALLDRLILLAPTLEQPLDRLGRSPLVGTMAARFMGRIVGEVVQANKEIAGRLPGVGSLMSFGTNAAARMVSLPGRQLEALLGDSLGKGGSYAVRRLNRILLETLKDPTTREAVLQVWDLAAQEPLPDDLEGAMAYDDLVGVTSTVHDLVVTALAAERIGRLARTVVDAFFDRFGGHSPTELLTELGLGREVVVADVRRLAPRALTTLRESGELERLVRAELEPFYSSPEVLAVLDEG